MWSLTTASRSQLTRLTAHRPTSVIKAHTYVNIQQKRFSMSNTHELSTKMKQSMVDNPVAWWLFGCAGLATATLTIGAAAKLTRSGASMLYWVPRDHFPPRSELDWHRAWELYGDYCHRHQRIPMSYEEFQHNYKYEAWHRRLGYTTTLAYVGPLSYFYVKERLPTSIHPYLAGVLALGAAQWYLGRRMVHDHVVKRHSRDPSKEPTFIASHGLTFHTAFSMANMALLVWAGLHLVSPASRTIKPLSSTILQEIGEVRRYLQYATALFVGTATAGTMVAGIDAGKKYNTFPKMNDQWIPDGVLSRKPWYRNLWENVATVQLDHRLLAITTLTAYGLVYTKARKISVWEHLPVETKKALQWTLIAVGGQAIGGISMLVNAVPTTLAMVHESGAALILGTSLYTLYTLRFARPMISSGMTQQAVKMATRTM